jgi:hypothetical protein
MILTLKVALLSGVNAAGKWEGVIEIHSSSLLEDLHLAIQAAVGFDNDHLYEFFVARTERSRERVSLNDENGGLYDATIGSLYPLPDRQHLYYLFDYGDYWIFRITRTNKAHQETDPHVTYPRLTHETGKQPEQYPAEEGDA